MDDRNLEIVVYGNEEALYVRLSGTLHLSNARRLNDVLEELAEDPRETIYVSLRDLDSIDSAGLGAIVRGNMEMKKKKKRLILLRPKSEHSRLFNLSKVNLILQIIDGLEAERIGGELEQEWARC